MLLLRVLMMMMMMPTDKKGREREKVKARNGWKVKEQDVEPIQPSLSAESPSFLCSHVSLSCVFLDAVCSSLTRTESVS